jgi:hypothetical protein
MTEEGRQMAARIRAECAYRVAERLTDLAERLLESIPQPQHPGRLYATSYWDREMAAQYAMQTLVRRMMDNQTG